MHEWAGNKIASGTEEHITAEKKYPDTKQSNIYSIGEIMQHGNT